MRWAGETHTPSSRRQIRPEPVSDKATALGALAIRAPRRLVPNAACRAGTARFQQSRSDRAVVQDEALVLTLERCGDLPV